MVDERTTALLAERQQLERMLMGGPNPQWVARFEERKADEAKVKTVVLRTLRSIGKLFGDPSELAVLGRRGWARLGEDPDLKTVQAFRKALASEMRRRIDRRSVREQLLAAGEVFVPMLERSQLSIIEVLRSAVLKKQIGWTPEDVVYVEGQQELINQISESLEQYGLEGYSQDVAGSIVQAADPRRPLTMPQVSKQIRNDYLGITVKKATLIARTETTRVYGINALTTMKRNGIKRRRWLTAAGSPAAKVTPVCAFCQDMASQGWVGVDEPITGEITIGVREPRQVQTRADNPPYHPYCRCDIAADTEGWLPPSGGDIET